MPISINSLINISSPSPSNRVNGSLLYSNLLKRFENELQEKDQGDNYYYEKTNELMSSFFKPLEPESTKIDKKAFRSEQKQALTILKNHFKDLEAHHQTEILKKFVNEHLEHLLFSNTLTLDAQRSGLVLLKELLGKMKDQNPGRIEVVTELLENISGVSTEKHTSIRDVFKSVLSSPTVPIIYTMPIELAVKALIPQTRKPEKTQNLALDILCIELYHARKIWKELSDDSKNILKNGFGNMISTLKCNEDGNTSGINGKTLNNLFSDEYMDPRKFDDYHEKSTLEKHVNDVKSFFSFKNHVATLKQQTNS